MIHKQRFILYFLLTFWTFEVSAQQYFWEEDTSSKSSMRYEDFVYESAIASVQLFPFNDTEQDALYPPVMSLAQNAQLQLEFDQFGDEADYFMAKIIK